MAAVEEEVKKDLTKRGLTPSEPETYRVLVTAIAAAGTILEFERLYNVIWASQIEILRAANERIVSDEEARKHYETASRMNPLFYRNYSFEQYTRFLIDQNVLAQPSPGQYRITVKGQAFLVFLVNTGKPLQRPSVY